MKAYKHDNGRICMLRGDGQWLHWENPKPEPGPRDAVDYVCRMDHPLHRVIDTDSILSLMPKNVLEDLPQEAFGFPSVGGNIAGDLRMQESLTIAPGRIMISPENKPLITLDVDPDTEEAERILEQVPGWLNRFLQKNANYNRAQTGHDLGAKGIMPDINRKTSVLLSRIWYGDQVQALSEDTVEVIDDLLGHLMLLREKLVSGGALAEGE